MKKSTLRNLGVMAVVLCLVTTSLLGGTLAKYTTEITGTGSATVAAWSFKVNDNASTISEVKLTDTSLNSKVTDSKIAPGTDGSFDVKIDASGSDVAVGYKIAFSNVTNQPKNLKFYSDSNFENEIDLTTGIEDEIALADVGTAVTETIYWQWAYDDTAASNKDNTDAGKAMSFTITVTGTQLDPTVASNPTP